MDFIKRRRAYSRYVFAISKCVFHDLITKEIPFKFIPKIIVNDNYHGLKTLCPCNFDRTYGFASLICEYPDKKFNHLFSNDVSQERCFHPTDSGLSCCNCQNIYKCFFHNEIIHVCISGHRIRKMYKTSLSYQFLSIVIFPS